MWLELKMSAGSRNQRKNVCHWVTVLRFVQWEMGVRLPSASDAILPRLVLLAGAHYPPCYNSDPWAGNTRKRHNDWSWPSILPPIWIGQKWKITVICTQKESQILQGEVGLSERHHTTVRELAVAWDKVKSQGLYRQQSFIAEFKSKWLKTLLPDNMRLHTRIDIWDIIIKRLLTAAALTLWFERVSNK